MSTLAELERDVEQGRAKLDASIEALQRRVSPAGLADEALGFLGRANGQALPERIKALARENPLPMLLVGLGLGLMMLRSSSAGDAQRTNSSARRKAPLPRRAGSGEHKGEYHDDQSHV